MKVEFAYAVVAEGGSGRYEHVSFLGIAFSWNEVKTMIDKNKNHPCPGERWEVSRRPIGLLRTEHLTVWRHDRWEEVETRKWRN